MNTENILDILVTSCNNKESLPYWMVERTEFKKLLNNDIKFLQDFIKKELE